MTANIIPFPALTKCAACAGTGLTWIRQRRTGRNLAAAKCETCNGTGVTRKPAPKSSPMTNDR